MSITALTAGLAPQPAPPKQATARPAQQERPHHAHGTGGGKPQVQTDPARATSNSSAGTTLNSLV